MALLKESKFKTAAFSLCLVFMLLACGSLSAQLKTEVRVGASYTDNLFQFSDNDLSRWKNGAEKLSYAKTTDDLALSAQLDLAYPMQYRWWTFTPSITGKVSQNVSNTDKHRTDVVTRFRVDRYYWSASAMYGYYPYTYYRHYTDTDGSGELEKYSYQRNLYRADVIARPIKNLTAFGNVRYENMYYNEHFTEADGNRTTAELGVRYGFRPFSVQGSYAFQDFDNTGYKKVNREDAGYQGNIYRGVLRMKAMPLKGESTKKQSWAPYLELIKEDRYYQGDNAYYGSRVYKVFTTKAGMDFKLKPGLNLSLDYHHINRSAEASSATIIRAKEFSENRISTTLKYKF